MEDDNLHVEQIILLHKRFDALRKRSGRLIRQSNKIISRLRLRLNRMKVVLESSREPVADRYRAESAALKRDEML